MYCGKIFIYQYKDEEARIVNGQHEGLVSEQLFNEVQEILEGRRRKNKTKVVTHENIPLVGFLKCPKCTRMLTGSANKGRNKYYYYYHCTSQCGERHKAGEVNKAFVNELARYTINPELGDIIKDIIVETYSKNIKASTDGRAALIKGIEEQNEKLSKARMLLLDNAIDQEDYKAIKLACNKKLIDLESKLACYKTKQKKVLKPQLEKALNIALNIEKLYEEADLMRKRKLIGTIYPEKLVYANNRHRTTRVNEVFRLLYAVNREIEGKKKGTSQQNCDLSQV
ncbi:MAG: recombinase family protein, partial [Cyclobacteriaceae bacterium]